VIDPKSNPYRIDPKDPKTEKGVKMEGDRG